MGLLACCVTHLHIPPLMLASKLSTTRGPEPVTMGGPNAFYSSGVPSRKTLPKEVLMAEMISQRFYQLGWSATQVSFSHLVS